MALHSVKNGQLPLEALPLHCQKLGRLQYLGADIEPDGDHYNAEQERESPAPIEKAVASRTDCEAKGA